MSDKLKIDLNVPLMGLDGKKAQGDDDATLGKYLGVALVQSTKGDPIKMYIWAQKLFKGEAIEVDKSDKKTIENFVNEHDSLTNLAKAQILEIFYAVKG